ncbi:MAG: sulfite exporter TauE/SafE family protein [Cyclobacteriaceae bacterium]
MLWWSSFTIGLLGSLHCIGMCGPIALALPAGKDKSRFIAGRLLYNLGRIVTYSIIGALFGLLGLSLSMAGFQQWVSIVTGATMIVVILLPFKYASKLNPPLFTQFNLWLKKRFSYFFKNKHWYSNFFIGLFNGLLPCGLVYVALAAAVASGSVLNGVVHMSLFGLGTLPLMLALSLAGNFIKISWRQRIHRMVPYFIVFLGLLFILRGLNLGIPYLSPQIYQNNSLKEVPLCQ